METEEIVRMLIFVLILVVMVWAASVLFRGRGLELLGSIRDLLRFGR